MKAYDASRFDEVINRKNTNSLKYDFAKERGVPEEILPLWVADMDFRVADEITAAITNTVQHGIYGYSEVKEDYFFALKQWYQNYFHWDIKREWLIKTPGVVFAIAMATKAFTQKGDAILIQQPVYYPFFETIEANERKVVNSPLINDNGTYKIDFEDFEKKIVENKVKMFYLCSPHNPVGRVWTKEELERIGDICLKYQVLVISDEIHSDFTYEGHTHTVFSTVKEEFRDHCIICTAPSKTFNLAGLQVSNIFIENKELKKAFKNEIVKSGYSQLNTVGLVAAQAAYQHGRPWLDGLKSYLKDNLSYVRSFLKERLPKLSLIEPQGTYLVWIDFRGLELSEKDRQELILHKAGLWLDSGSIFGMDGEGYERINIACPRSILKQAMEQLEQAMEQLEK